MDIYNYCIKLEDIEDYIHLNIQSNKLCILINKKNLHLGGCSFYNLIVPVSLVDSLFSFKYYEEDETCNNLPINKYLKDWMLLDDTISREEQTKVLGIISSLGK